MTTYQVKHWVWMLLATLLAACGNTPPDSTADKFPVLEGYAVRFLETSFESALAQARTANKALLVDFYADW